MLMMRIYYLYGEHDGEHDAERARFMIAARQCGGEAPQLTRKLHVADSRSPGGHTSRSAPENLL
jgi:hypothetical protein